MRKILTGSLALLLSSSILGGCSSAPKKTTPELSNLEGKKIALVEIVGEDTARRVAEVSLINQIATRGTFLLVSKQDLASAKSAPNMNPTDWKKIAKTAGADFALRMRVLQFDAITHEGYSAIEEEDSQLAAEQGEEARKTERVVAAKSLDGQVSYELEFTDLGSGEVRKAIASAQDTVTEEARTKAIHLPPKLRFLEELSNHAFKKFFDQYQ